MSIIAEPVDKGQKEFMFVLAYLYVCHSKYDEALIAYRGLYEFFPNDKDVMIGLSLALYFTGRSSEARRYIDALDGVALSNRQEQVFYLLKSHVLWNLGIDKEARQALVHYLGFEEKNIRRKECSR